MRPRALVMLAVVFGTGCAGRLPPPQVAELGGVEELRHRMASARPEIDSYVAEARLTYFGPEGRVRSTATLAVARPDRLRYEMHGPHGGIIEAFATNGREMQLYDVGHNRFVYGPVTVDNIDRLLAFAPLHLDASEWVSLLFGEVRVHKDAVMEYDAEAELLAVTWSEAGMNFWVGVDPETWRVARATVSEGDSLVWNVVVEARDRRGLPERLHLRVPRSEIDLEIRLRDVAYDPELTDEAFQLDVPRGITPEYLGG